jgi:hypothetical protein
MGFLSKIKKWSHLQVERLRAENEELQYLRLERFEGEQSEELERLREENDILQTLRVENEEIQRLRAMQNAELNRLRYEECSLNLP